MKIRVQESRPGELAERIDDAINVLRKVAGVEGCTCCPGGQHVPLAKALVADPLPNTKQVFEYPVLTGSVAAARTEVDRIREVMLSKFAEILGE